MDNESFLDLLDDYLEAPADPNPELAGVETVWIRDDPEVGLLHIELQGHRVSEEEIRQVLFEMPPYVEAKKHADHADRTIFWGATREDRWLFISCVDWTVDDIRYLKPITAFEPDEGEEYWRTQ